MLEIPLVQNALLQVIHMEYALHHVQSLPVCIPTRDVTDYLIYYSSSPSVVGYRRAQISYNSFYQEVEFISSSFEFL